MCIIYDDRGSEVYVLFINGLEFICIACLCQLNKITSYAFLSGIFRGFIYQYYYISYWGLYLYMGLCTVIMIDPVQLLAFHP